MEAKETTSAERKKLALKAIQAVDAMYSAVKAARDAGLRVELTRLWNGEETDISEGMIRATVLEELWPPKERPGY